MNIQKFVLVPKSPKIKGVVAIPTEKDFAYGFLNGQSFVKHMYTTLKGAKYKHYLIGFSDFLTPAEVTDVEESWREIQEGQSETFTNVNEFLDELKR